MSQPVRTPIDPGLIARIVSGVRYAVSGVDNGWMSPGQPIAPVAQEQAVGRAFDFDVGFNTRTKPRGEEQVNFSDLRALADGYGLVRVVIETRKDQLSRLKFNVRYTDPTIEPDERCKQIEQFLRFPDQEHTWNEWLRMVLEDLFVLDAPTIYPRKTIGGAPYALEVVDGSTIKRVLDVTGRTPMAPDPAYQQIIKGLPAVDYSRDELIYKPRNLRPHKVYGYSPVEQIINTINVALRRELYQLQYFTEGSTPDLIMQVPPEWNPDQIKQFDAYWQSRLAGNTAERRKSMFVPSGVMPVDTKERALHDAFDEWIARIVCYAFSISHQAFVKEVNKATAQTAKDSAIEEGLEPIMRWVCDLMDIILARYFGAPDLCFDWCSENENDPLVQAQIQQIYLVNKVMTPDEVRADIGLDPLTPEQIELLNPPPPPALAGAVPGEEGEPGKPGEPDDPAAPVAKAQKKSPYVSQRLTATEPRP